MPGNAFQCSLKSPVKRGVADFAVHARGLKAGQMKDGNFIAGGEAEEILITGAHDVERITITGARGEADGLNLRGNRGGVKLVTGDSEQIGAEILKLQHTAKVVWQGRAGVDLRILTAVVPWGSADAAILHGVEAAVHVGVLAGQR